MGTTSLSTATSTRTRELSRRLGLFDATSTVVGSMIGSGIFVVPSIVLSTVGDPSVALAAWIVGGALTLFGTLTLAELGAVRPQTGGIYVYLRDAFGPVLGFLYGWATFWVMQTGSIAAVAVVFGTYAARLAGIPPQTTKLLALGAIWLLTIVNMVGVRRGAVVQNVFTAAKFLALLALVVLSFVLLRTSQTSYQPSALISGTTPIKWSAAGVALLGILFSYEGWTFVTFIGGEIKNPQRTLPCALVTGVSLVIAIYLLANIAYLRVLAPATLAQSSQPAADVAVRLLGRAGATFITCAIVVSTFGAVNGLVLTGARSYFAMARDNLFFKSLGLVNPRFETPAISLFVQAAWSSVLVLSGSYTQLFTYVIFAAWTFYALAAGAVFVFRRKYESCGYRTPGYPFTTIAFILAAAALVLNTLFRSPRESLIGLAIVLSGLPAYWRWRRH